MENEQEDFEKFMGFLINLGILMAGLLYVFSDFFFPKQSDMVKIVYSFFASTVVACCFYDFITKFKRLKKIIQAIIHPYRRKKSAIILDSIFFAVSSTLYVATILIFMIYPYEFFFKEMNFIENFLQYVIMFSALFIITVRKYAEIFFTVKMRRLCR